MTSKIFNFLLAVLLMCSYSNFAQTGSFRVVIERVECVKATNDDVLERDGKGDEIQVCAVSKLLNKKSNLNAANADNEVITPFIYGDINTNSWKRPFDEGRIKAGDRSTLGGIQDNNMFPYGDKFQRLSAPTTYSLPLIAWSGMLQNKVDSVMIVPFVAEWDDPGELTTDIMNKIGKIFQGAVSFDFDPLHIFGEYPFDYARIPGVRDNTAHNMIRQLGIPGRLYQDERFYNSKSWFGDPHTRAVGMVKTDNGYQFEGKGLWLNYKTATLLAETDFFGFGKGRFILDYKDADEIGGGEYRLYITLEKNDLNAINNDNRNLVAAPFYLVKTGDHSHFVDVPGNFRFVNLNSGKALGIKNAGRLEGDAIVQSTYRSVNNQLWKLSVNNYGEYRFRNNNSGQYMDVTGMSSDNGAAVIQWNWKNFTETSNNNNQRWILQPQGDGTFLVFNLNSGRVLEIQGESRNEEGTADQWDNNAARHQLWKIEKVN